MMKDLKRILIIDSNISARSRLRQYLEKESYEVDEATDGETGIQFIIERDYHLLIVELELPGISGVDVCNIVRKIKTTPIIALIANGEEKNMLSSLRTGLDDYILKPFRKAEIIHRVNDSIKRATVNKYKVNDQQVDNRKVEEQDANEFHLPNAVIEWDAHRIIGGGYEIYLTPKEYELLYYLTKCPSKILSRDELLKAVWKDEQQLDTRTAILQLNVYVINLTKSLLKLHLPLKQYGE